LESFIISKSSVPITEIDDLSHMALVISRASPIALVLVEFIRAISSNPLAAARNPTAEPTRPAPIMAII
jgi:hypothetical protein